MTRVESFLYHHCRHCEICDWELGGIYCVFDSSFVLRYTTVCVRTERNFASDCLGRKLCYVCMYIYFFNAIFRYIFWARFTWKIIMMNYFKYIIIFILQTIEGKYFYFYLVRDINESFPNNLLFDFNHDKEINE